MSTSAERAAPRPALPPDVLLTTEEFRALPQPLAGGLELHDGRVVEVAPVNLRHGRLQNRIGRQLGAWCEAHELPEPVQELACELMPGRTVAPDVAYLSSRRCLWFSASDKLGEM
jgi:Uma2 family endonuclease